MKSFSDQLQVSTPNTVLNPRKPKHNLDIRLACVEDGLDNTGFRKIAAYIKFLHPSTKVAYIPTANHRNLIGVLMEKGGGNLNVEDIKNAYRDMSRSNF